MSIILVDTFHHLSSSHPYTEPLEHYSVQILQSVSILFVIVMRNYWWPRVMKDIGRYVEDCDMCQKMKNRTEVLAEVEVE